MLTERQKKAETLAHELRAAGAAVTSALPLADGAKLRFQVLDSIAEAVLADLRDSEWSPALVGSLPRICIDGMKAASLYQIDLPSERQPIPNDRQTIQGERASREKTSIEIEALRKYLGMNPK
jgi:hypothetical protein